jgi:hypothetical protein
MPIVALARMHYAAHGKNQFDKTHRNLLDLKTLLPPAAARLVAKTRPSATASLCRIALPCPMIGTTQQHNKYSD